jgi:hypothetical protein
MISMPNLLEEARSHFNEPVLIGFDLCRVIGYGEDGEDCYLIVRHPHRGIEWCTFVGGYVYLNCLREQGVVVPRKPLAPGEIWSDYTRLDNLLELNGAPKEAEFLVKERGE